MRVVAVVVQFRSAQQNVCYPGSIPLGLASLATADEFEFEVRGRARKSTYRIGT